MSRRGGMSPEHSHSLLPHVSVLQRTSSSSLPCLWCVRFVCFRMELFSLRPRFTLFLFTRSRRGRCPLRTPAPPPRCPEERCPRWADGTSSAFCTRSPSVPTGPCVSVEETRCCVELRSLLKDYSSWKPLCTGVCVCVFDWVCVHKLMCMC